MNDKYIRIILYKDFDGRLMRKDIFMNINQLSWKESSDEIYNSSFNEQAQEQAV